MISISIFFSSKNRYSFLIHFFIPIETNSTKEETTPKPERLCVSEFGRSCDENDNNNKPVRYNESHEKSDEKSDEESGEESGEDSDYEEDSGEIEPVNPPDNPSSEESEESEEDDDEKYKPYEEKNHTKPTYYTVSSN